MTDLIKPRSISMVDSDWLLIKTAARENGVSVSEFVRVATLDALEPKSAPIPQPAAVRIPPVPSSDTVKRASRPFGNESVSRCKTCGWILIGGSCKQKCAQK